MIKTEYYNNILCVEAGTLISTIMPEGTYKSLSTRNQIRVLRRGCKGTPALVDYNSIPERFKKLIIDILGSDPQKITPQNHFISYIHTDPEALQYFSHYLLQDGRNLKPETQLEYYNNAIVLNAMRDILNSRKAMRKALGGKTTGLWGSMATVVNELPN